MVRYRTIEFDRLQMYFGEPYVIDVADAAGTVTVYQPTLGDVIKLGENRFFSTLNVFLTNTTSYKLTLWDAGIDWNVMTDFELFMMMYKTIDSEASRLLFKDLDFSRFVIKKRSDPEKGEVYSLMDETANIEINEEVYQHFHQYLQTMFNIFPEEKYVTISWFKEQFIRNDRDALTIEKTKEARGEKESTSIQPVISACVNHPGFKYKLAELKDVGVCEFYDSVRRLQLYENATAIMKGLYSGMIDGKKIDTESYNFMRDFSKS